MNKSLPFLLLCFIGINGVNAQVRMAAYVGVHSASVIEKNHLSGWDTAVSKYYAPVTGFHIGVMLEIPLGNNRLFFQPAIGYTTKGRQYSKYNDSITAANTDTMYSQSTLKLSYVEIPLYLTYKLSLSANHKNSFFISAGPYFSFFYSGSMNLQNKILSTNQFNTESDDLPVGNAAKEYKTLEMGINAKAGFELGNVMLSGFFSQGLSNFYTADYRGSFHHQLFGATLGIWFSKASPAASSKVEKDSDYDGIPDSQDACPFEPGVAKYHGCPVPDSDGDGIDDDHDSCRTVPGVARYNGCPVPDSDGDGIDDEHDSCRTVPGLAKYNGCPIPDRDGDGINDEEDKCPDQPGTLENQGCPVVLPPKVKFDALHILFMISSDQLTPGSFASLDELVTLLASHPEFHLTIEGYADNSGIASHNKALSQSRASAVKKYLVSKGIASSRIRAIGRGQENPIANNHTAEGKAANRRVELKLEERK